MQIIIKITMRVKIQIQTKIRLKQKRQKPSEITNLNTRQEYNESIG